MTLDEQINKMYNSNLASQTETLAQDYQKADSELTAQKQQNQKVTDANLTRTAVEAQKAAANNAELHNAYGLSSGTMAQARLSQENQLQADLTALRAQQQAADAEVERQRGLLRQEYTSSIRQAQAENDMARAQALYAQAQTEDERMNQQKLLSQQRAWQLEDQNRERNWALEDQATAREWELADQKTAASSATDSNAPSSWDIAKFVAEETGDFTLVGQMLGMDQAGINRLNGVTASQADTAVETMASVHSDTTAKPTQTDTTYNFVKNMPSWEQVQRETPGFDSYDQYIASAIYSAWSRGHMTDGEAKWLINRYGVWWLFDK